MSKPLCYILLAFTLLASCQASTPLQAARPGVAAMSQTSSQPASPVTSPTSRATVGTAKELFAQARQKALDWNPAARLTHVEGNFISANGRNDFPMDAVWTFEFINPANRFIAYQVAFRSEYTQPAGQEIPRGMIKAQTPIDESNWAIDSSSFLQAVTLFAPTGAMFSTHVELLIANNQLIWQMPVMNSTVRINARDGKPVTP